VGVHVSFNHFIMGLTTSSMSSPAYGECGGIDPYTLMAPHGPHQIRWPDSPKRAVWISGLLGEPCIASRDYLMVKET
jgi:hypothetical protein